MHWHGSKRRKFFHPPLPTIVISHLRCNNAYRDGRVVVAASEGRSLDNRACCLEPGIRQPDVIRPAVRVDRGRVTAVVIPAVD